MEPEPQNLSGAGAVMWCSPGSYCLGYDPDVWRGQIKKSLIIHMFVTAKNKPRKKKLQSETKRKFFFFSLWSETKRKQAKKLGLYFRLSKRKQSETDPVSLRFASKRKKILSETGAP
jgi:hypothetical protein